MLLQFSNTLYFDLFFLDTRFIAEVLDYLMEFLMQQQIMTRIYWTNELPSGAVENVSALEEISQQD